MMVLNISFASILQMNGPTNEESPETWNGNSRPLLLLKTERSGEATWASAVYGEAISFQQQPKY